MAGFRRLMDEPDSSASQGDVYYADASGDTARLAAGTAGKVLTTNGAGADPTWETPSAPAGVVLTTTDQSIAGAKTFTGELIVPTSAPVTPANGHIWHGSGDDYFGYESGTTRRFVTHPNSAYSRGEIMIVGATIKPEMLAPGTSGYVLTSAGVGADPAWAVTAPVGAQYLTLAVDATLTSERVATAGSGISITDAGAGSTATFALSVSGLTAGNIADPDSDYLPVYDDSAAAHRKWTPDMLYPVGYLYGLTLANNGTDPTNDIDIATGIARDSTDATTLRLLSALTKRLDAAWAVGSGNGGLDTGAIANGVYHVWLIMRSDTGVVDALFSTSVSAPTMPTNYDYKRLIGSIIRVSAAIKLFSQVGDLVLWDAPVEDIAVTNLAAASGTLFTMTVPTGYQVEAYIDGYSPTSGENWYGSSPDQDDETVSNSGPTRTSGRFADARIPHDHIRTDTSGRIRARANVANTDLNVTTRGYKWDRGRTG